MCRTVRRTLNLPTLASFAHGLIQRKEASELSVTVLEDPSLAGMRFRPNPACVPLQRDFYRCDRCILRNVQLAQGTDVSYDPALHLSIFNRAPMYRFDPATRSFLVADCSSGGAGAPLWFGVPLWFSSWSPTA